MLVKLGDSGDVAFVKVPLFYLAVGRIAVHCFFGSSSGRMDRICYREIDLYNGVGEKGRLKGVRDGFSRNATAAVEAKRNYKADGGRNTPLRGRPGLSAVCLRWAAGQKAYQLT